MDKHGFTWLNFLISKSLSVASSSISDTDSTKFTKQMSQIYSSTVLKHSSSR
jgi:hypothetical protein